MIFALLLTLAGLQDFPATRSVEGTSLAKPARDADGTQRWSILPDACAKARGEDEVVVCAPAVPPEILIADGPPDRPMPSNPDVSGIGALAVSSAPCATRSEGCTTGVDIFGGGTFLVRAIGKIIDPDSCCDQPGQATNPGMLINDIGAAVKRTFRKKPDKSNRVPIPLDDPAPAASNGGARQ